MSDLDRYKEVEHGVIISPDGEYVWFHDYEKLKAELNQRLHERTQAHLKSYRELKDQNLDLVKQNQRLRDLLKECNGLLIGHHDIKLVTFTDTCPVCSKNHTEHYPNNIFGRIESALASPAGEVKCKTCDDTGIMPALVDTPSGLIPCPYLGEPCQDCDLGQPSSNPCQLGKLVSNADEFILRADVEPLVKGMKRIMEAFDLTNGCDCETGVCYCCKAIKALETFTAKHGDTIK